MPSVATYYDLWDEGEGYNPYNPGKNTVTINKNGKKALVVLAKSDVKETYLNPIDWKLLHISDSSDEESLVAEGSILSGVGILQPVNTNIFSTRTESNTVGAPLLGLASGSAKWIVGDDDHNIKIGGGSLEISGKNGQYIAMPKDASGNVGVGASTQQQAGVAKSIMGSANFIMEHIGNLPQWNPAKFFDMKTILTALHTVGVIYGLVNGLRQVPKPPKRPEES